MKEDIAQVKVAVSIRDLWKAMSSDIRHIVPKVIPDIVEEAQLLEGDGGRGSIFLFKFCPDVKVSYQKEKIVEFNESLHQITLKVVEGGPLDRGYLSYMYGFKFTAVEEGETRMDVKVAYETKPEHTHFPGETLKPTLHYIKCLENYLLNGSS